jgi:hypothetical protein
MPLGVEDDLRPTVFAIVEVTIGVRRVLERKLLRDDD